MKLAVEIGIVKNEVKNIPETKLPISAFFEVAVRRPESKWVFTISTATSVLKIMIARSLCQGFITIS